MQNLKEQKINTQTLMLLDQCIFHWALHLYHCFLARNAIDLSMIAYHSIHQNSNNQQLIANQQKHRSQCILILTLKIMISWFVWLFQEDLLEEQHSHSTILEYYYCLSWFQYPFDVIQEYQWVCGCMFLFRCCSFWIGWLFVIRERDKKD